MVVSASSCECKWLRGVGGYVCECLCVCACMLCTYVCMCVHVCACTWMRIISENTQCPPTRTCPHAAAGAGAAAAAAAACAGERAIPALKGHNN